MSGGHVDDDGKWRVRGVSVPGYAHLRDGVECQDAYRHRYVRSASSHVLAIADGAGSADRSAEGSALAVGLAVSGFGDGLAADGPPREAADWHRFLRREFEKIVTTFGELTTRIGNDPAQFATTMTVAVVSPPWIGIVSLGDAFVVARAGANGRDGFHLLTFLDAQGEYANETVFLTSRSATTRVIVDCVHDPELTALILATDGLATVGIVRDEARRRHLNVAFFDDLVEAMASRRGNLARVAQRLLEDDLSRLSADDKTLLVALRP